MYDTSDIIFIEEDGTSHRTCACATFILQLAEYAKSDMTYKDFEAIKYRDVRNEL